MKVQVWQSFSCNNSTSYYLVARFDSEARASEVATEVRTFLTTHAREKDAILDERSDDWDMDEWSGEALGLESVSHTDDEELLVWSGGEHAGFSMRSDDEMLAGLRAYLDGPGIAESHITLQDESVREKLTILIGATACPECQSAVRYIPADDNMAEDQLACESCGGMFALSTFS